MKKLAVKKIKLKMGFVLFILYFSSKKNGRSCLMFDEINAEAGTGLVFGLLELPR